MPEIQDTPFTVACADLMQATEDTIAIVAAQRDLPPIALTLNLIEQLIGGLRRLDPDATLTLLEAWSNLIVIATGDDDEADLICPAAVRREMDAAVRTLREAITRTETAA